SRALAACAKSPDDYARVYQRILAQVQQPVIIHWLGDMFDPQLAGYWGSRDLDAAMDTCLAILQDNAAKIDGIKISLLDAEREIVMRRRLPAGVKMYTGDDFNYPTLILGDEQDEGRVVEVITGVHLHASRQATTHDDFALGVQQGNLDDFNY